MKIKKVQLNNNFLSTPIAHRGLHSGSTTKATEDATNRTSENSLDAFRLAKLHNLAIEIDVHRLKDGEFAVFHDKNMKRVTGTNANIDDFSSKELENIKLWDGQKIPLLQEVLKLVNGEVPLLIELKPENGFKNSDLPALLKIIDDYNHPEMVAFQSFNPFSVHALKKLTNKYAVGILSSYNLGNVKGLKNYVAKSLMLQKFMFADFISYDINFLPNKFVTKKSKKYHIPVLAWVVNTKEKSENASKCADNIIFENFEILEYYEQSKQQ